jgi:hypothetical protein
VHAATTPGADEQLRLLTRISERLDEIAQLLRRPQP